MAEPPDTQGHYAVQQKPITVNARNSRSLHSLSKNKKRRSVSGGDGGSIDIKMSSQHEGVDGLKRKKISRKN